MQASNNLSSKPATGWTRAPGPSRHHPAFSKPPRYSPRPSPGFQGAPRPLGPFFEAIKERLLLTFRSLAGKKVVVKKDNGVILEGILLAASPTDSHAGKHVVLNYVKVKHKPFNVNESYPPTGRVVIDWSQLAYIHGDNSTITTTAPSSNGSVNGSVDLKTDQDISKSRAMLGKSRELKPADSSWLENDSHNIAHTSLNDDSKGWDQFKVNEEKFGVKTTFDENLYTTKLDKTQLSAMQIKKAEELAKEIENSLDDNVHLREERNQISTSDETDEEAKYSAVALNTSANANSKPLNFAAALLKGKNPAPMPNLSSSSITMNQPQLAPTNIMKVPPPPKEPHPSMLQEPLNSHTAMKTPMKISPNSAVPAAGATDAKSITTPRTADSAADEAAKKSRAEKYQVQNINFEEYRRELDRKVKELKKNPMNSATKNAEAHMLTKDKYDIVRQKARKDQIEEFKKFSTQLNQLGKKKELNVNAEEFKPPVPEPPTSSAKESQASTTAQVPKPPPQNSLKKPGTDKAEQVPPPSTAPSHKNVSMPAQNVNYVPVIFPTNSSSRQESSASLQVGGPPGALRGSPAGSNAAASTRGLPTAGHTSNTPNQNQPQMIPMPINMQGYPMMNMMPMFQTPQGQPTGGQQTPGSGPPNAGQGQPQMFFPPNMNMMQQQPGGIPMIPNMNGMNMGMMFQPNPNQPHQQPTGPYLMPMMPGMNMNGMNINPMNFPQMAQMQMPPGVGPRYMNMYGQMPAGMMNLPQPQDPQFLQQMMQLQQQGQLGMGSGQQGPPPPPQQQQ